VFTEELVFSVNEHRLAGTKIFGAHRREPSVVHLHGLGPAATRHGVRYLLDELAEHGHGSLTFEFSGNGDSTGVLAEATLGRRREESLAAVAQLRRDVAPVLIGTSMGAHLAAMTVPVLRPRGLVLFVPAAYPDGSDDLKFDGSLAKPGRYADSPAFAGIREFDGDLLIVAAKNDQVVPSEVIDGYLANARNSRSTEVLWFDCDHLIHRWLPGQETARADLNKALLQVFSADHVSR
jgi:pimeloyl-ACP methyl ester carboxylesterase